MKALGKWIEGLAATTPIVDAARLVLTTRLELVARLLSTAEERKDGEYAHQVRVSSRRASAALEAFEACLGPEDLRRARKRLKRIRRAAGTARECDVHAGIFSALAERASEAQRPVIEHLRARIARERQETDADIRKAARRHTKKRMRALIGELCRGACDPAGGGRDAPAPVPHEARTLLIDEAARVIGDLVDRTRAAADDDLGAPENLHALRLRTKNLRYALEIFAPCFGPALRESVYPQLESLQDLLGGVNDMHQIVRRLDRELAALGENADTVLRDGVASLRRRYEAVRDQRHREAIERATGPGALDFLAALRTLLARPQQPAPPVIARPAPVEPAPSPATLSHNGPIANGVRIAVPNREESRLGTPGPAPARTAPTSLSGSRRLAAIDVGTNSIRLLVAEAHADGSYRVLDDEKEITRLGRGLGETGVMSPAAMEHTVQAVERMKRIAMGYGVHALRAVGTSACREARNREAFVEMLRARTGITLEVIGPHDEARLAYLSAAHSFDLRGLAAAVVDIGGGSTEIILSAGGVTEQIYSLPLGAVRMTEQFGGPEEVATDQFKRLRRFIKRAVAEGVGDPPLSPQLVIGTGGTFTTLANILIHREHGPLGPSLWDRGVPGHEAHRSDVRHVLDRLRRMPLRERERVPGLPAERADIIIAGLAIAERVLKHLGVNAIRVHDRGIRDGLVIQMAEEIFPPAARIGGGSPGDQALRAVRRFAESCRYEADHSEHVTSLALSIYDQIAEREEVPDRERTTERRLLEAAGVLHDCGYLVNYSRHHKHSYHLIVHSDIAGFTRREIEVIANVARYHRQAEPKRNHPNFAALAREDRALVQRLAAVLRLADGLDRTHTQNVRAVKMLVEGTAAQFLVSAPEDPATDLWGASKKSGLFRAVFDLEPQFTWVRAEPAAPPAIPAQEPQPAPAPIAAPAPTAA